MDKNNNKIFAVMAVILFIGCYFNPMHFPLAIASTAIYLITSQKQNDLPLQQPGSD